MMYLSHVDEVRIAATNHVLHARTSQISPRTSDHFT